MVLSGGRAVAATRGRRRGSAAEYGLPFFTAAPPRATGCTSLACPAASGPEAGARPGGRVRRRRARARPRPEHDERARQGVRSRAEPDAAAPDRGERHRAPGRGSRARAARPGEVRAGRGPQGTSDAGRARLPPPQSWRRRGAPATCARPSTSPTSIGAPAGGPSATRRASAPSPRASSRAAWASPRTPGRASPGPLRRPCARPRDHQHRLGRRGRRRRDSGRTCPDSDSDSRALNIVVVSLGVGPRSTSSLKFLSVCLAMSQFGNEPVRGGTVPGARRRPR